MCLKQINVISLTKRCRLVHERQRVLLAVMCALFLVVSSLAESRLSANNAATFVLLRGIDTDAVLRRAFYDAPANTTMTIPVDGYEVLAETRNSVPLQSAYTSSLFSRGSRGSAALPYRVRLSDEWVLLEKPLRSQSATVVYTEQDEGEVSGDRRDTGSTDTALLHCRLPLPRSAEELHDMEADFIDREGPRMRSALEEWWWHMGTPERGERCLYGDGESGTTGVPRYYSLCPTGRTTRVRHHELKRILTAQAGMSTAHTSASGDRSSPMKAAKDEAVIDFLRAKDRQHALSDIADDAVFAPAFEVIGQYHATLSKPWWNREQSAWEILYPSTSPCHTHLDVTSDEKTGADETPEARAEKLARFFPASWRAAPTSVRSNDAFWKTVVRFRCSDDGVIKDDDEFGTVGYWAITDMRRTCTYQMEIATRVVCGWEQELDRLQISAIPCAVLGGEE